jgi:hypothetical protein
VNTSDKWKSNQPQTGGTQDMSKKDPSRQPGSGERNEQNDQEDNEQKRRAS